VPSGLEKRHNTKAGVWARFCALEGKMIYRILEPFKEENTASGRNRLRFRHHRYYSF
jgi:tellurite resistance-related uncharacterized protein